MTRWNILRHSLVAWVLCATAFAALAAGNTVDKFALVIGNGNYKGPVQGALPNSVRDADLMAQSLKKLGFQVTLRSNLGRSQMLSEVTTFAEQLPQGATSLVYYAGHGMQVGGGNYMVPVDMEITGEQTVPLKAYPLKTLLERLSASKSAVNIVVLDACRANPFQPPNPVRYRNFANLGLASIQAPRGTLVAYSTAPGQLAADGKESHSVYTSTLATVMLEPNLEIREIFQKTASQVRKKTLDDQIPWLESSITENYYFLPPDGVTVVAGKPLQTASAGRGDTGIKRGREGTSQAQPVAWFDNLTTNEWDRLDMEIQQRASRLTADEIPEMEHKAKGGSVVVQTTLGIVYRNGVDKTVDSATGKVVRYNASNVKALQWLRMAADAGFAVAQVELGEMYNTGHGVDRDVEAARRWLEKAAKPDYKRAQLALLQTTSPSSAPDNTTLIGSGGSTGRSSYKPADFHDALLRNDLPALRSITANGTKLTDHKVFAEWLRRKFNRETGQLLIIQDAVDEDACQQYSASLSMDEGVPVYFEIKPGSAQFEFLMALKACRRMIQLEAETFELNLPYQRSIFGNDHVEQFRKNLKALAGQAR